MMNFETVAVGTNAWTLYLATNSIKPVIIRAEDEATYFLDMPAGDLYNDHNIMGEVFDTFEEAKRWAETYVGMKMNTEDF